MKDLLERERGVALLIVIERVDLVVAHESADRETVFRIVVLLCRISNEARAEGCGPWGGRTWWRDFASSSGSPSFLK